MIEFHIDSMTCGHCVSTVTKTVKVVDPVATVDVDLQNHTVRVESTKNRQEFAAALSDAGYPPK